MEIIVEIGDVSKRYIEIQDIGQEHGNKEAYGFSYDLQIVSEKVTLQDLIIAMETGQKFRLVPVEEA